MSVKKNKLTYKISDISKMTDLSADTLRYYEKIGHKKTS